MPLFGIGRRPPALRSARPQLPAGRSLTASGERVTAQRAEQMARLSSSWQKRAFVYYDALGEIKYAARFYSRLSRLRLYAAEWVENEDGERELRPTADPLAIRALDRIRDPGGSGGRSNILGNYGRLMFLAGEAILFYTKGADGGERWETLSTSEIRANPLGSGGGRAAYQRIKAPSLSPEDYREPGEDDWADVNAKEAIAYRLWQKHPQWSEWPDSPMKGVLDICEQLLMLDRAARSRAVSRTAGNGILFLDDRISPAPPTPEPGEDPAVDVFVSDLTGSMVEPMQDEGAAEHVVPLVVRVPVPIPAPGERPVTVADLVHHLRLTEPGEFYPESEQIEKTIHRLALGLDMPPEVLEGKSGGNHWSAWEVSEDAWEHLEPYADQFCEDVTAAYYIPTLRKAGVENAERFTIAYDPASLRREPERAKDAKDAHRAGAIGNQALRDALGFSEDDAPTDEEFRVWLSVYSRDPKFALTGELGDSRDEQPPEDERATSDQPGGDPADVEQGPPEAPVDRGDEEPPSETAAMIEAQVLGALEVAVGRARDLASSRLVSRAKTDPDAQAELAANRDVHAPAVLGAQRTRRLAGMPESKLVDGFRAPLVGPLRRWGLTDDQMELVLRAAEQHAIVTLYERTQRPFPAQFRNYVASVIRGRTNGDGRG